MFLFYSAVALTLPVDFASGWFSPDVFPWYWNKDISNDLKTEKITTKQTNNTKRVRPCASISTFVCIVHSHNWTIDWTCCIFAALPVLIFLKRVCLNASVFEALNYLLFQEGKKNVHLMSFWLTHNIIQIHTIQHNKIQQCTVIQFVYASCHCINNLFALLWDLASGLNKSCFLVTRLNGCGVNWDPDKFNELQVSCM